MNINKDGKTLYFSDEEIDNTQDGEKKVFVTKRINGKESHVKYDKINRDIIKNHKEEAFEEVFNFNDEYVIGVNPNKRNKADKRKNNKDGNSKNKKRKFWRKKNKYIKEKKNDRKNDYSKNFLKKNEKNKIKRTKRNYNQTKKENNFEEDLIINEYTTKKPQKRKIRSKKPFIIIMTIVALLIAIIVFALTAPIFNITQILVEGNNIVTSENIINLSDIKKGENIFKFNKNSILNIKENKYIQDVLIKIKMPGTVEITVKERSVKYQLNLINSYVYIDKSGNILEIKDVKANVPVITGLNITEDKMMKLAKLEENDIKKLNIITKIMEALKSIEVDNIITEINITDNNNVVLYLESENKKIYIGDDQNLTNKMLYVKKILEIEKSKSGIVFVNGDIVAGFKPYFREE